MAASPSRSPARTARTYVSTRSSISCTECRERERSSRSVVGCDVWEFGESAVAVRRSTLVQGGVSFCERSRGVEDSGRTPGALGVGETQFALYGHKYAVLRLGVYTNGRALQGIIRNQLINNNQVQHTSHMPSHQLVHHRRRQCSEQHELRDEARFLERKSFG